MRSTLLLTMTLLTAPVTAQVRRLVDSIEAPVAYLCLEAAAPAAGGERPTGPVQRLLADPSLEALLPSGASPAGASTRALALVRGLLARSSGELELALTSIVPNGGQPLLVLRARLQRREADNLQQALDNQELGVASRRLGGRTVFRLPSEAAATAPGQEVELALVGADLVMANDATAMREVLEPQAQQTAANAPARVLSADPRFVAMRQKLPTAAGSLWLYGDWQRLGHRLGGAVGGLAGGLVGTSGLGGARAIMASIGAGQGGLAATMLLDFDVVPAAAANAPSGRPVRPWREPGGREPGGPGPGRPGHDAGDPGIDGWFAAVEPVAARTLVADLPTGGLGGCVLSVDLADLAQRSHEGWHLIRDLEHAFDDYGLDFRRTIWSRLGSRGTVQLHLGSSGETPTLGAVYAVRTKNKKAAADLFADVRRVGESAGLAAAVVRELRDGKERRTVDLLELRGGRGPERAVVFVGVHEDSLLLSADADSVAVAVDDLRRSPRGKRSEAVAAAVAALGSESVGGVFDVDLAPWFDRIGKALSASGAPVDLSTLPQRHVGFLDLQQHANGTVVRVRVVSSR